MPGQGMSRTDDIGLGLNLILNCWNEMIGILGRRRSTGKFSPAASKRWEAISALMRNPSRLIAMAAEEEPIWRWRCAGAGMLGADDSGAIGILKGWAAEAMTALQERCTKLSSAARIGWTSCK